MLGSQAFMIGLGLFFAVMPAMWMTQGWGESASGNVPGGARFFMSFFVLAGLYIVGGCLLEVFGVGRTVYAVTSRRALILKCFMRRRVLAIMPSDMNALDWHENRDGSGSIIIRREVHEDFEGKSTTELGFVGTRDIRGAVREIEKLRAAKHSPESRAGFPEVPTSQD